MEQEPTFPVCISCRTPITPKNKGVKLTCPNCGQVTIWRCLKCRKMVNTYKCPNCFFEGP